ncbi:MAG: radical SAM protein [Patescibacteria group bacterium]|nr:radical SAM protein [Patescibacteria group bacterium]
MKNKKITFKLVFYRTLFSQSAASLTMGSVAAFLRQNGFVCDLCLMERQGLHNAEKILQGEGRKIVIAKPNFKDYSLLLPLLAELKKQREVDSVFFCGPFACLNYHSIMKKLPWLDGILIGDAEETSLDLARLISAGKKLTPQNCSGGVWRKSGGDFFSDFTFRNSRLGLNGLPFPARDVEKIEKGSFINIEASRGCNGGCSFCHIPLVSKISGQEKIDYRSPRLVVDEMEKLNGSLGKKLFIFNDSCFWRGKADNARIIDFCKEIKKRKLSVKFYVYLKVKPEMPEDILSALHQAGLVRVFLGIENISSQSQDVLNKKIALHAYEKAKTKFDKFDINIHIGYIVVEPYSRLSAVAENLKHLRKIDKLFRLGTILEPVRVIPGSGFHKKLVEDGLLEAKADFNGITYGYRYKDRKTARFIKGIKSIFEEIKDEVYEFEYFCTTAFLLKSLLKQDNNKIFLEVDKDFSILEKTADKAMDSLLDFLLGYIDLILAGHLKIDSFGYRKIDFFSEFKKYHLAIKVKHAEIVNKIGLSGGADIIDCIYTGLDRIN